MDGPLANLAQCACGLHSARKQLKSRDSESIQQFAELGVGYEFSVNGSLIAYFIGKFLENESSRSQKIVVMKRVESQVGRFGQETSRVFRDTLTSPTKSSIHSNVAYLHKITCSNKKILLFILNLCCSVF